MATALNRSGVLILANKTGAAVDQGDVVVLSDTYENAFETTLVDGYLGTPVGVVLDPGGIENDNQGAVVFSGYVPKINLRVASSPGKYIRTSGEKLGGALSSIANGVFGVTMASGISPTAHLLGSSVAASSSLSEMADVNISSPLTGDFLQYVSGNWQNKKSRVACRLHKSSTQSVTAGNTVSVQWDVEDFDYGGFFDAGSNTIMTIPEDGVYLITAGVHYDTNAVVALEIQVNSSEIARQAQGNSGIQEGVTISTIYDLNAGDTLTVRFYASGTGNIQTTRTHFGVSLISRGP